MPVCPSFDTLGGFVPTAKDLADMTGLLMHDKDFSSYLKGTWNGLRIGFDDANLWQVASSVVEAQEDFKNQAVAIT